MKQNKKLPTLSKSGDLSKKNKNFSHKVVNDTHKIDISSIILPKKHGGIKKSANLPELLSPAGSRDALIAALNAGADAVYFGGGTHNARINAKNFTREDIEYGIKLLHAHGKKAYITLNTLLYEKETGEYLDFVEFVANAGADALIVADLGGAELIRRTFADLELHASTQMSGHNVSEAELLHSLGFSRMVLAREMPKEDIEYFVKNSPIESEVFIHGALCVCHSGQCLFSSLVGGRSGNRGECAQPCRLPDKSGKYPLSLKDLSLASHIRELIAAGVHSLKIEGRMKAPEYVFGVTRAYRTLLDCASDATENELHELAKLFSRGGFTDGYFERSINRSMLGVRSEHDKIKSREISLSASADIIRAEMPKLPVSMHAKIARGVPCSIEMSALGTSISVLGQVPDTAINAPLTEESVKKSLSKLGDTEFSLSEFSLELDEGLILPVSALNSLRRECCERLSLALHKNREKKPVIRTDIAPKLSKSERKAKNTARFFSPLQIPENARSFFDIIYLPLDGFDGSTNGIIMPPVIFDSEKEKVKRSLAEAAKCGARYALVGNLGALRLAKAFGLIPTGDFRLNVYNSESVSRLEKLGLSEIILSPELTLPQMRDIKGDVASIVYGRIPLMLLEKCVIGEIADCSACENGDAALIDRRGISFPVLRESEHRNVIYNSLPTYMADRAEALERAKILNRHFIFSIESEEECAQVVESYKRGAPSPCTVRRM